MLRLLLLSLLLVVVLLLPLRRWLRLVARLCFLLLAPGFRLLLLLPLSLSTSCVGASLSASVGVGVLFMCVVYMCACMHVCMRVARVCVACVGGHLSKLGLRGSVERSVHGVGIA